MNDQEKSDLAIVAVKPPNKTGMPAAEAVEPRAGTKGNTEQQNTHRTQIRTRVIHALDRVRQAARQRKKEQIHRAPPPSACVGAPGHVAFRYTDSVGARDQFSFAAQWLACTFPCRRFADILTNACARLGADVGRYSFIAVDLHHLLLAGLPAHLCENVESAMIWEELLRGF